MSLISTLARYNLIEYGLIEWFAPEYRLKSSKVPDNMKKMWFETLTVSREDAILAADGKSSMAVSIVHGYCVHRPLMSKTPEKEARQAVAYVMCIIEKDYKMSGGGYLPHFMFIQSNSDIALYIIPTMPPLLPVRSRHNWQQSEIAAICRLATFLTAETICVNPLFATGDCSYRKEMCKKYRSCSIRFGRDIFC